MHSSYYIGQAHSIEGWMNTFGRAVYTHYLLQIKFESLFLKIRIYNYKFLLLDSFGQALPTIF